MIVSGLLSGGAPVVQSYQCDATSVAGEPMFSPATANAGLIQITTAGTAVADYVGITLDAAAKSTTQGSGSTSAEALNRVVINPDAIIRIRLSGSATVGTDLTAATITTADSAGTSVIATATTWTEDVDGYIWGISGANVGQRRVITAVSGSTATIEVPFDTPGPAVGDTFGWSSSQPGSTTNQPVFTSDNTELDAQIARDTSGQSFGFMQFETNGLSDSYAYLIANGSMFS